MIGQTVGNYRIDAQVGEVGVGTRYRATHSQHHFAAFLAVLRPEYSYLDTILGPAQAAAQTGYWGIARPYEGFMHAERSAVIVTEPLEGESLAARLEREPRQPSGLVIWVGWQIASALAHAHDVGVVHGLLRPESVFLIPDNEVPFGVRVKVLDFGLYGLFGSAAPNWKQKQTAAGLGKPHYLAPEQLRGGKLDARTDVYALACLLYHMAARQPPFTGKDPADIAKQHLSATAKPPKSHEGSIPPALDALIMRNLGKEPSARMQSMKEVAHGLEQIAQGESPQAAHAMPTMALQVAPQLPDNVTVALNLGHFVAPKHDPKKKRWPIVVAILAIAGIGGGAAALLAGGGGDGAPDAAVSLVPPTIDAGPLALLTPAEQKVIDGRKALTEERWADAIAAAREAKKLDPKLASAAALEKQAQTEQGNLKLYDDFARAVKGNDATTVARRYKRIPADSFYRRKGAADYTRVRDAWLKPRLDEAAALAAQGECKRIESVAKRAGAVFPEAKDEIMKIPCNKGR